MAQLSQKSSSTIYSILHSLYPTHRHHALQLQKEAYHPYLCLWACLHLQSWQRKTGEEIGHWEMWLPLLLSSHRSSHSGKLWRTSKKAGLGGLCRQHYPSLQLQAQHAGSSRQICRTLPASQCTADPRQGEFCLCHAARVTAGAPAASVSCCSPHMEFPLGNVEVCFRS